MFLKKWLIKKLLPKGVEDPGISLSKDGSYSGMTLEEIRKAAMQNTLENNEYEKEEKNEDDYMKVPDDVLASLKSHPDGKSRASAIHEHISEKSKLSRLERQGISRMNTVFVRNWSYDEDSDSVVISDSFTRPEKAGSKDAGITGIDVDASLGF